MKRIYAIETTSVCNNACSYCPHHTLVRGIRDRHMPADVFARCIDWLYEFKQDMVHLHVFGEPLLDPGLCSKLSLLNGIGVVPSLSTNGRLLTPEMAQRLGRYQIRYISVSPHTPDAVMLVDDIKKECPMPGGGYTYFSKKYPVPIAISDGFNRTNGRHNWAGQVICTTTLPVKFDCSFIHNEECVIYSNGDVVTCCIDAGGVGKVGNILTDDLRELKPKRTELCDRCHHVI